MSTLLYIDTSAATATVALSANGSLLAIRRHHNAQEQAAVLNLLIEEILKESGLTLNETDAVCVCAGPGSYTGLRVGLSTAKGICYALDKPLLLFNKLELIARDCNTLQNAAVLTVALKARLGEYFVAGYDKTNHTLLAPQHIFEAGLAEILAGTPGVLVTDTDIAYPAGTTVTLPADYALNVDTWITFAETRFAAQQFDNLAYSEPFYLKAAFTTQSKK